MTIYAAVLAGLVACISLPFSTKAQSSVTNDFAMALNSFHPTSGEAVGTVTENQVNTRAISRFHKSYPEAVNVSWTYDHAGSTVQFVLSNQEVMERYTTQGRWVSTVRTLAAVEVPNVVRETARVQFPRYEVSSGRRVKTWAGECYILGLKNGDDSKVIMVVDEDVEVLPLDSL